MTFQNLFVLKQYRSFCFCSSVIPFIQYQHPWCHPWMSVNGDSQRLLLCFSRMTMNARHKRWAGKCEQCFIFRLCEIVQSEFYTGTDLLITTALEPLAIISAFVSDEHPAFLAASRGHLWKRLIPCPRGNVFCLSLLGIGWRRHAVGRACWFGWAGPPRTAWHVAWSL